MPLLNATGHVDDPAVISWDNDEPVVYVATDIGILIARRGANGTVSSRPIESHIVPWDEVRGATFAFTSWLGESRPPEVSFHLDAPEFAESARPGQDAQQKSLLEFGAICMKHRAAGTNA
ncbi:MAG: hypothetical protein H0U52_01460 [Chloroflexi bacterium]|nr:hypothetical protein [Chloroflexota bacterium]